MKLNSTAVLITSLLLMLYSCNSQQNAQSTEATLRWTGMVAADGCGFFVDINGQEYKPVNEEVIPQHLQQQETTLVSLTYELQEEPLVYSCGMLPERNFSAIKILDIQVQ